MKQELINQLFTQFQSSSRDINGIECWSARELQSILGYSKWVNFNNVIEKAKVACAQSGNDVTDHFADIGKLIEMGKGAEREIEDIALTRYACYLIAQNGDSNKSEIAFAQTYFAVQTRKQEIIENRLQEIERVTAREKLTKTENKLSGIIYERDVDNYGFANIRSKGDQAFFGGFTTSDMKKKLKVPDGRPLADFLPTLAIKAKDFATELTSHNVVEKDLVGESPITNEHIENNKAVRRILGERGVKPELLPAAEDVQKVKRKLASEEKAALKTGKPKKNKK
jgi:DNA-damage-inducible protein D